MLGKKVNILVLTLLTLLSATTYADTQYSASVCNGGNYLFGCQTLTPADGSGIYTDDSDATKHVRLTFGNTKYTAYTDSILTGEKYLFGCQVLSSDVPTTIYVADTLQQVGCGCDSTVNLTLLVKAPAPQPTVEVKTEYDAQVLVDEIYLFGCKTYQFSEPGPQVLTDTIHLAGKDSIITVNLTVAAGGAPTEEKYKYSATIKQGEIYLFGCHQLSTDTVCYDTIHLAGVDSIIQLTLTVEPAPQPVVEKKVAYPATIKEGEIYLFGCLQLTADTTCYDTIHLAGLDSIIQLTLTVEPAPQPVVEKKVAYPATIKEGEIYLFGCLQLSADTVCYDTIHLAGLDSIIQLTLTVEPACPASPVVGDTVAIVCESDLPFLWHGMSLMRDTTLCDDTLKNVTPQGCDSIVRLALTVQRVKLDSAATVYICPNTPYNWIVDGHDFGTFTEENIYRDTIRYAAGGCDSAHYTLDLKFYQAKDSIENKMIYFGDSYEWYVNGTKVGDYNTAGTYYDTLRNQVGCDSIRFTLNLTQECNPVIPVTDTVASVCESDLPFLWHGMSLMRDTTFCDDTVKNSYLCDSIVRLALTVQRVKLDSAATVYICPNTSYNWIVDGHDFGTFTEENIYRDTIRYAAGGCDSAHYTLDLKFYQAKDSIENKMIYFGDSYAWIVNGVKVGDYNTAGTYYDTLRNQVGCDSIRFTLNLTQECNPVIPVTDTVATVCESDLPFLWHGMSLMRDTTFCDDTVKSVIYACDSVIHRLTMTVLHPATGVADIEDCDSVFFKGVKFTADTLVYDTIAGGAVNGCDSIVAVTIKVNYAVTTILDKVKECNMYQWKTDEIDTLITTTGTYSYVLKTVLGCDSTITLDVEITTPYVTTLSLIHKFGDRLLMINRNEINAMQGWHLDSLDIEHPEYVSWYEIDPNGNEKQLPDGYSYSLPNGEPLPAGYTYYATINIPAVGDNCGAIGSTDHYTIPVKAAAPALMPSLARPGEDIRIVNLDPDDHINVRIYSADGIMHGSYSVNGVESYTIRAEEMIGFYMVELQSERLKTTLRYIVK